MSNPQQTSRCVLRLDVCYKAMKTSLCTRTRPVPMARTSSGDKNLAINQGSFSLLSCFFTDQTPVFFSHQITLYLVFLSLKKLHFQSHSLYTISIQQIDRIVLSF